MKCYSIRQEKVFVNLTFLFFKYDAILNLCGLITHAELNGRHNHRNEKVSLRGLKLFHFCIAEIRTGLFLW